MIRVVALIVVACMLTACSKDPPAAPSPGVTPAPTAAIVNTTTPRWVVTHTPKAKVAVVYVHGIFGDTLGTWTNENNTTFFDLLDRNPKVGAKVDQFAFGFTSNMFKAGSLSIGEASEKLYSQLQYHGVLDYPTVVIVAHSMGGLVALTLLTTHRDLIAKTPLLYFYATPQEGAQITDIATKIIDNPGLVGMFPADRNLFLQQLDDQWKEITRTTPNAPHIRCAYEKRPTHSILIVPRSSGTRFCDGASLAIDADHIHITKPANPDDEALVGLVNALNEYVLGTQLEAKIETPDFVPEGDYSVFTMDNSTATARLENVGQRSIKYRFQNFTGRIRVSPEDSELGPEQKSQARLDLLFGANTDQYSFVLHTEGATVDRKIIVRVPNMPQLLQQQKDLISSAAQALSASLTNPQEIERLNALPPAAAEERTVEIVNAAVAERTKLPPSESLIMTADLLNALNLPQLSIRALQKAEQIAPQTAQLASVKGIAARAAAGSGQERVFANVPVTPASPSPGTEFGDTRGVDQLAQNMQRIGTLRAYGLSLEGDAWRAKGSTEKAREAYQSAESLRSFPITREQIRRLPSPPSNLHVQ